MSLNIRLKHSAQANKKPQVADLTSGELALNINGSSPAGYALDDAGAVQQMFGKATETQEGQAEIATQPEVDAGTDDERIVTPKKLGQRITDYTTNTVTPAIAVETAARTAAITAEENARVAGDDTLTQDLATETTARIAGDQQNATDLAGKVDRAGDTMTGALTVPDATVSNELTVNGLINNPGVAKAWGGVDENGALAFGFNVGTTVKNSTGTYTVTFSTPFPNNNYCTTLTASVGGASKGIMLSNVTATSFDVVTFSTSAGAVQDSAFSFHVFA